jgi:hypothetical protein
VRLSEKIGLQIPENAYGSFSIQIHILSLEASSQSECVEGLTARVVNGSSSMGSSYLLLNRVSEAHFC